MPFVTFVCENFGRGVQMYDLTRPKTLHKKQHKQVLKPGFRVGDTGKIEFTITGFRV